MPISTTTLLQNLEVFDYRFFAGVPCSYFGDLYALLSKSPHASYVPAANEGSALAVAAGAAIAGRRAAIIIQNSGLGNIINPLTSLLQVNQIPVLIVISVRGDPNDPPDEPQHRIMGASTRAILDVLGVGRMELPDDPEELPGALDAAEHDMRQGRAFALLVRRGQLVSRGTKPVRSNASYPLTSAQVITLLGEYLSDRDVLVSSTGYISREVFSCIDRPSNFYMQGSLGHASGVALGLALSIEGGRRTVVVDGDGAALMHMGALSTVGHFAPPGLIHVVLDNEGYASTGDQESTAGLTDLHAVAAACRYTTTISCDTTDSLRRALSKCFSLAGPCMIVAKINSHHSKPLPRVTSRYTPEENHARVSSAVLVAS